MGIRISAVREIEDPRKSVSLSNEVRRNFCSSYPKVNPLDPLIECRLGRLRLMKVISEAEYEAGCQWRTVYHNWLRSIGAPKPFAIAIDYRNSDLVQDDRDSDAEFSDDQAEAIALAFRSGERVLKDLGERVFHAVAAIAVYDEPQSLGSVKSTVLNAKKGLRALAECGFSAKRYVVKRRASLVETGYVPPPDWWNGFPDNN